MEYRKAEELQGESQEENTIYIAYLSIIKKKMLKKGGPDGSLRPGMSMKKLVTNSSIVCPKNVIKIWTFYKKKMKFLIKLLRENYNAKLQ